MGSVNRDYLVKQRSHYPSLRVWIFSVTLNWHLSCLSENRGWIV